MKKLISMLMAGAMVLALAVPALATDLVVPPPTTGATEVTKSTATTNVKAATQTADIKLTMPTVNSTGAIVVNPYGLSVKKNVNGGDLTTASNAQIIAPSFYIENKSNVNLDVAADVTTTLGGNMKLAAAAMDATAQSTTKTNTAYIAFTAQLFNTEATAAPDAVITVNESTAGQKTVALKAGSVKLAGTSDSPFRLNAPTTDGKVTCLGFTFSGQAAKAPTTPWDTKDTVSIAIAWTFTPVA